MTSCKSWLPVAMSAATLCFCAVVARADSYRLSESPTDLRVFGVTVEISQQGKFLTSDGPGKTKELKVDSNASFSFRERRLPPAGRDAKALRAVREFESASMTARIADQQSNVSLPTASRLIVANGERDGVLNYSTTTLLTRDLVDLLEIPGDPLTLLATLPQAPVETNVPWPVPEWAAQMLSGVEAVESANMTGTVASVSGNEVQLHLNGVVKGLREGARTTATISGTLTVDVTHEHLSAAALAIEVKSDIGAVSPGIDATVSIKVKRRPTQEAGRLTDPLVAAIPLEPPAEALKLVLNAPPWNNRLRHDRGWYVFYSIFDQPPKVAILRLLEQGSLICQCNISPIPDAAPGSHTPLEQFTTDIRTVLGDSFRGFQATDEYRLSDGRAVVVVVAQGEVKVEGEKNAVLIPMEWRYFLCANPDGRQVSFVFAVEPHLVTKLAGRDRDLVTSLEFLPVKAAKLP